MISSINASVASFQGTASRPGLTGGASSPQGTGGDNTSSQSSTTSQSDDELAATDRRVRAHEAAHLAASGGLAKGGANFELVKGSDGRMYAVGGEVQIDVSPGRTPEETVRKADQIRRAALAPADPSAQDYRVAAQAAQMMAQAQQELARQRDAGNGADGGSLQLSQAIDAYADTRENAPSLNLFA